MNRAVWYANFQERVSALTVQFLDAISNWYRFLVTPAPDVPATISKEPLNGTATA